MLRLRWYGVVLALGVAGCATLRAGGVDPGRSLDAGLRALAAGDYGGARVQLDGAAFAPDAGDVSRRALLAATLAELDPRNPERDYARAAERAAALRRNSEDASWMGITGEVLVELAAELSGTRARIRRAELASHAAVVSAALARQSVDARIAVVADERDTARRRLAEVEQTLAEKEKELKEKTQELERIRRTIRR